MAFIQLATAKSENTRQHKKCVFSGEEEISDSRLACLCMCGSIFYRRSPFRSHTRVSLLLKRIARQGRISEATSLLSKVSHSAAPLPPQPRAHPPRAAARAPSPRSRARTLPAQPRAHPPREAARTLRAAARAPSPRSRAHHPRAAARAPSPRSRRPDLRMRKRSRRDPETRTVSALPSQTNSIDPYSASPMELGRASPRF